jgi:O6-methylguanine-DNA--protein-cysteine methyltransferase
VVASGGRLGGYAGGLDLKARLLAMERSHASGSQLLF